MVVLYQRGNMKSLLSIFIGLFIGLFSIQSYADTLICPGIKETGRLVPYPRIQSLEIYTFVSSKGPIYFTFKNCAVIGERK